MIDTQRLLHIYKTMVKIRKFEEMAVKLFESNQLRGSVHLYIGEEAIAATVGSLMTDQDYITSTHRGHGHAIAKGATLDRALAELMGKATGYCKGRGGSMHIADVATGNLGANGIVGGGLPIAVGAALAIKKQKRDDVAMCFFGDGASNEGAFHEALNMAAIWKLPVVFVCENNKYGMSVSTERSMAVANVADRAAAYGMPGHCLDGNDLAGIAAVAKVAIARARSGEGPSLIECKTYRWRGHSKSDRNLYRSKEEIEEWRNQDPIRRLEDELKAHDRFDAATLMKLEEDAQRDIDAAVEFARACPDPDPKDLTRDVYAL